VRPLRFFFASPIPATVKALQKWRSPQLVSPETEKLAIFVSDATQTQHIMATIKLKFRPSTVEGKEGVLFFQVIRNRKARSIRTGYRLLPREWDERSERILLPPGERCGRLAELQRRVDLDLARLQRTADMLERQNGGYTHEELVSAFRISETESFFGFMHGTIARLRDQGRIRTGETYDTALRSFARFRRGRDLRPGELNSEMMAAYEAWLRATGLCKNTSSFYMRILRAAYNRAVEKGLAWQTHPFRHVYTGVDKTVKRALSLEELRCIRNLELTSMPSYDFARDMFLFSFYTRGMAFVDMTYLKRSDLKAGILTYRRQKTGQTLSIRWEPCMQEIVDRYPNPRAEYLLPIIRTHADERHQYKNMGHQINRCLKVLGDRSGFSVPLTLYVARHTWASIARSRNIPLAVISESMGHDSEATTRIYLASLDTAVVDRANRMVIDALSDTGTEM